jgi:hypothetical protein
MLSDNLQKLHFSFALETLEVAIMDITVAGVELNHEPESAIHGCAYQPAASLSSAMAPAMVIPTAASC